MQTDLHRRTVLAQWLILGLALLTLASAGGFNLFHERSRITEHEAKRLLTQTQVIQENLGHNLTAVNHVLGNLADEVLIREPARKWQPSHLALFVDAIPGVHTLHIIGADGIVQLSNRPELVGRDFSHWPYFLTAQ